MNIVSFKERELLELILLDVSCVRQLYRLASLTFLFISLTHFVSILSACRFFFPGFLKLLDWLASAALFKYLTKIRIRSFSRLGRNPILLFIGFVLVDFEDGLVVMARRWFLMFLMLRLDKEESLSLLLILLAIVSWIIEEHMLTFSAGAGPP